MDDLRTLRVPEDSHKKLKLLKGKTGIPIIRLVMDAIDLLFKSKK